jgi:hypothetical protein
LEDKEIYLFSEEVNQNIETIINKQPFLQKVLGLWALLGDNISLHYTGTNSVLSDLTKTGK